MAVFEKGGVTREAANPAHAVELRRAGWRETRPAPAGTKRAPLRPPRQRPRARRPEEEDHAPEVH